MQAPEHIAIKEFLVNSPEKIPKGIFLFAHGAARGMANEFMDTIASGIIKSGLRVVRFHFPYMEEMLRSGTKRRPDDGKILRHCFSELIQHCIEREQCPGSHIIIGGKSMGGRMATRVADENKVAGVICLGYPFHAPKKTDHWRIKHLKTIQTPTLICQGEHDRFGNRKELDDVRLSKSIAISWITGGDHHFKPVKPSDSTQKKNMQDAIASCNTFIDGLNL